MRDTGRILSVLLTLALFSTHAIAADDALVTLKPTHPVANPSRQMRPVDRLTFSADGSRLLVQTGQTATLWNLATRKPAYDLAPRNPSPNPGGVSVFSTNGGAFFVVAEGKGNFAMRDVATGATRGAAKFPPQQQATGFPIVPETVLSRDGRWMACAFNSHPWGTGRGLVNGKPLPMEPCKVILFDTRTGTPRHTWTPKTKDPVPDQFASPQAVQDAPYVFALEFSPDGRYLATATIDGNVAVYDTAGGREVGAFNAWDERRKLAPTPRDLHQEMFTWTDDGKSLIMPASVRHDTTPCWTVTGKDVRDLRWPAEPTTATPAAPTPGPAKPRSHLPTPTDQMRQTQERLTGRPADPETGGGEVAWEAFSPDTRYAVFAFTIRKDGNPFNDQARLSVADLSAGRNLGSVRGIAGAVTYVRFSPDGKRVAWGTQDGAVFVTTLEGLIAQGRTGH